MKRASLIQSESGNVEPSWSEICADRLALLATEALIEEARLSPKPGLVDSRGSGAHDDLSLPLMLASAHSLTPTFHALGLLGWERQADAVLRREIGRLGRVGEQQMMAVTHGVNTHRGAIWALGLLVSALAMLRGQGSAADVVAKAAAVALLPDDHMPITFSKGQRASRRYRVPGAKEEAQHGFPHVIQLGLPQLRLSRQRGASESEARLDALLAIMTHLPDTCVLSRGGMPALEAMHQRAAQVLDAGGVMTERGKMILQELDQLMLALHVSPGGAADLLSATLFLDWTTV
jgi:triphosphoribosyl-dephospho-CoA synthase